MEKTAIIMLNLRNLNSTKFDISIHILLVFLLKSNSKFVFAFVIRHGVLDEKFSTQ